MMTSPPCFRSSFASFLLIIVLRDVTSTPTMSGHMPLPVTRDAWFKPKSTSTSEAPPSYRQVTSGVPDPLHADCPQPCNEAQRDELTELGRNGCDEAFASNVVSEWKSTEAVGDCEAWCDSLPGCKFFTLWQGLGCRAFRTCDKMIDWTGTNQAGDYTSLVYGKAAAVTQSQGLPPPTLASGEWTNKVRCTYFVVPHAQERPASLHTQHTHARTRRVWHMPGTGAPCSSGSLECSKYGRPRAKRASSANGCRTMSRTRIWVRGAAGTKEGVGVGRVCVCLGGVLTTRWRIVLWQRANTL